DTLGGVGSRERDKDILEQRRQQWIKDLNEQSIGTKKKEEKPEKPPPEGNKAKTSEIHWQCNVTFAIQQDPIVMDHAFSAKKKQQQQRWREELDKQLLEQKEQQAVRKMRHDEGESPEEGMWARHFDTMKPTTDSVLTGAHLYWLYGVSQPFMVCGYQSAKSQTVILSPLCSNWLPKANKAMSRELFAPKLDEEVSPRTNHLRTMTSLLDPAQIDAIELRRQKQQEHRRAITEQVEERQRIKREEERRRKMEEEDEERKLEEERMKLQNQFEREKNKQHAMEEKREKQTQHLYQQMQEAKASALKDKLERREEALRNRGHDTSRLEKTHMNTLNIQNYSNNYKLTGNIYLYSNIHKNHRSPERGIKVPSIDINDLHSVSQHSITGEFDKNPVSVITNPNNNGPIKLEISVNQTSPRNVVEAGSQTARNNNDHEYDKYARDDKYSHEDAPVKSRKNNEKPKWGVGQKKKQYKPASKRYVNSNEWKERHESNVRRREEQLLAQQAMNETVRMHAPGLDHKILYSRPDATTNNLDKHWHIVMSVSPPKRYHDNSDEGNIRPPPRRNRSRSPPVPHVRNQLREHHHHQRDRERTVNESTESDSPVPETIDFVEYRRSDVILDPNQPPSRPETAVQNASKYSKADITFVRAIFDEMSISSDPLINADMVKQRERQDKILKEISILRQGLLLKQREVASYPVAMNVENRNLTERMNDVSMD
uniref:CCDC66 domain-containing protein n=1 Tax=Ciona intestinalis TaxID=7719 RepID=F6ZTV7_CIOIN